MQNRNKKHTQYYCDRGYTTSEASQLASEYNNEPINKFIPQILGKDRFFEVRYKNCSLIRENAIKRIGISEYEITKKNKTKNLNGKRKNQKDYWMNLGYSIEESIELVSLEQKKRSKRCLEYWITRGYTIGDSIQNRNNHQNTVSKKSFINRFGNDLGEAKYTEWLFGQSEKSKRSLAYWIKTSNETTALDSLYQYQSNNAKQQKKSIQHWLNLGYSFLEAKSLAISFAKKNCSWCIEYWIDRGVDIEEAEFLVSNIQKNNAFHRKFAPVSLLEIKFRETISKEFSGKELRFNEKIIIDDRIMFPDIIIDNICIELYGDYWHANPRVYENREVMFGGYTAKSIREKDEKRIDLIKTKFDDVIIVWESDYLSGNDNYLKKIKSLIC